MFESTLSHGSVNVHNTHVEKLVHNKMPRLFLCNGLHLITSIKRQQIIFVMVPTLSIFIYGSTLQTAKTARKPRRFETGITTKGMSLAILYINRRRTNVQQLTCKIDLASSFYYLFFSFVLLELKPFVLKGKVPGEKFWKSAKKCEKVWNDFAL